MVIVLVTRVWLTWTLLVPVIVPTVTLMIGAFCGGAVLGRVMVSVKVVPRAPLAGETLEMAKPPPVVVPETGSKAATEVRATL